MGEFVVRDYTVVHIRELDPDTASARAEVAVLAGGLKTSKVRLWDQCTNTCIHSMDYGIAVVACDCLLCKFPSGTKAT